MRPELRFAASRTVGPLTRRGQSLGSSDRRRGLRVQSLLRYGRDAGRSPQASLTRP